MRIDALNESARIMHAEDLIFFEGSHGALRAAHKLLELSKGNSTNTSLKFDGSPCVIFGRDSRGTFVMSDKSGFTSKTYNGRATDANGLAQMFLARKSKSGPLPKGYEEFAANMASVFAIFEQAVPTDYVGYFKGDLLYFSQPTLSGADYNFTPNVVTYSVSANSALGQRIASSTAAVVVHRSVDENGDEFELPQQNIFTGTELLVMPPVYVNLLSPVDTSRVTNLIEVIDSNSNRINSFLDRSKLSMIKLSDLGSIFYSYLNSKVDTGMTGLGKDFQSWLTTHRKSSAQKQIRIIEYIAENKEEFVLMWEIVSEIAEIKVQIITALEKVPMAIRASIAGHPGGEGYVSPDAEGDIKLVSRDFFTKANRSVVREIAIPKAPMQLKLINSELCESKMYRNNIFSRLDGKDVANLLYLNTLLVVIMVQEESEDGKQYASKTAQFGAYTLFRTAANDLYLLAYQTAHPSNTHIKLKNRDSSNQYLERLSFDATQHWRFMIRLKSGKVTTSEINGNALRLESQLKISDGRYKAWRRDAAEWDRLSKTDRERIIKNISAEFRRIAKSGELLSLNLKVKDSESSICGNKDDKDSPSTTRKVAGAAAGAVAGRYIGGKVAREFGKSEDKYKKVGTGIGAIAGYWAAGRKK